MDTSNFNYQGKVIVNGYVDTYYGYNFNKPATKEQPYFVSMARNNEFNINLAYIDVKYSSARLRARFVPGFGTYINANYAAEPGVLKNIVEGNVGVKLFANKNIWLDAGVFGSPYTNESAISKDHLMYTRSFAPEYVPYYLSGVKLTLPLSEKITTYLYLLNGWQQIADPNEGKSLGTQLEFRPNDNWLLNWNTYVGNEQTATAPQNRMRYFSDVYFIYAKGKWSATGCVYYGIQKQNNVAETNSATWWQANLIGKYSFTEKLSLSGRLEYFDDPESVQITSINPGSGFSSYSTGLCLNVQIASNVVARFEGRSFFSKKDVYQRGDTAFNTSNLLISNLTIWF
ncbi:MAG: porin [Cyclobacteriaceae bacterium]|nr:porin [Cyclobacteriaceae bacterium]